MGQVLSSLLGLVGALLDSASPFGALSGVTLALHKGRGEMVEGRTGRYRTVLSQEAAN